jgi:hypothetical protein
MSHQDEIQRRQKADDPQRQFQESLTFSSIARNYHKNPDFRHESRDFWMECDGTGVNV